MIDNWRELTDQLTPQQTTKLEQTESLCEKLNPGQDQNAIAAVMLGVARRVAEENEREAAGIERPTATKELAEALWNQLSTGTPK